MSVLILNNVKKKLPQNKEFFICRDFNCNMLNKYALFLTIADTLKEQNFAVSQFRENVPNFLDRENKFRRNFVLIFMQHF